jgi:mRNA-degrading endonuclease RelE of RelBE toxin-antitoxin system
VKIQTTRPFERDYGDLPESIKEQSARQLTLFLDNPHHPSPRVKKTKGYPKAWEGRVTKNYRFPFQIEGETDILRRIGPPHILKTP